MDQPVSADPAAQAADPAAPDAAAQAPAPTTPAPPGPGDVFVRVRNPSRRTYLVVGLAVAVVIAAFGGLYGVQEILFGPEVAVKGYFKALADRDADAAMSYVDTDSIGEARPGTPGFTLASLKGPGYTPPTRLRVKKTSQPQQVTAEEGAEFDASEWRDADVEYWLGDNKVSAKFFLHQRKEKVLGLFRRWRLAGGISYISVTAPTGAPVVVNGAALMPSRDSFETRALLGRYVVGVADNPLWEAPDSRADVPFAGTVELTLRAQLKASATTEVEAKVRAYVEECAKSTELEPPNCPFSAFAFDTVTGVTWSVERYPTVSIDPGPDGTLRVRTTQPGLARVSGTRSGGTPYTDSDSFYVYGTVTVQNGQIAFTPRRA